jgi:hypothetical protein
MEANLKKQLAESQNSLKEFQASQAQTKLDSEA